MQVIVQQKTQVLSDPDENDSLNSFEEITTYNNFYEFGMGKTDPAENSGDFKPKPWSISLEGLINNPQVLDLEKLLQNVTIEDRVYRLRCVEAWSMVIPWQGFPLELSADLRVSPFRVAAYPSLAHSSLRVSPYRRSRHPGPPTPPAAPPRTHQVFVAILPTPSLVVSFLSRLFLSSTRQPPSYVQKPTKSSQGVFNRCRRIIFGGDSGDGGS